VTVSGAPDMDHAGRRTRLVALLADRDLDGLVVTSLVNVRYLTGFSGSNGAVLVGADGTTHLATDSRYTEQAADESPDVEPVTARACTDALVELAARTGVRRLGFEAHVVTVDGLQELLALAGGTELVASGPLVETLRTVKDEAEVALLREACAISDRALADLLPQVRPGLTERQVARALEDLMRDHGADGLAFDSIVASGPYSAVPHHAPTDRALERGDLLKLDFGARAGGYHADMTRTCVLGEPADWQAEIYAVVATAQRAGREALAPGAALAHVDAAARSVVEAAGLGERFGHGLGHGVGLEIHEAPLLSATSAGTLVAGTPVTVEPGVYLPGRGGVRIEDTLVVRDGAPELLTTSTKDLLVLG
jgi:Xaa-Pro dipeptidase